ncbi:RNA methyltransferase [Mesonia sp. K7]|uniref:TrmH family RNA methyltransferase n=1 Tax=Mesonia sp. K7 TaxID=2218606 RepID=UPI000DA9CF32|nr:RNA methyltransferase [Mesonia sp. K7]PZD79457.1 RNA methyltransferase [Mesonia sp. K7]
MKKIESLQNKTIKHLLQLQAKSKLRRKENLFVIEGKREISLALDAKYQFETLLFCSDFISENELKDYQNVVKEMIEISMDVYQKVAYRNSTEGVIAIVNSKNHTLKNLKLKHKKPLILVAEAPEKPGNIGALLRTADAAHLDAVIIANPKTDLYNPNIIRSSVGCLFTTNVFTGSTQEIIDFLKKENIHIYCATLQNSNSYEKENYRDASAIVVGTEDEGLSQNWRANATQNIIIPMEGKIDSLNVSVAAAILIFEAKRQRNS